MKRIATILSIICLGSFLTIESAHATDGSWNVDAAGDWSNSANWLSGNIADGAGATGNFTFNITAGRIVTIDGAVASRTLGIMNIGDSTGGPSNYTIAANGGGTLTFDNGGSNAQLNETSTSGNNTISAPIILNGSLDITNASANNLTLSAGGITAGSAGTKTITTSTGTVTVSGVVGNGSGTVAVLQNGPGTLALTAVNTYSGNTTIAGGKITVDGDATLGDGSGTLFLSGGTLTATASRTSDVIANNISLTADSTISSTSAAASANFVFTGTLSGSAGTLTFRNDSTSASNVFAPRFSGGDFTTSRPIVLTNSGSGGTTQLNDFNTTGTTHQYDGVISGNGGFNRSASVSGTGGTTVFTAANTYTGGTTISQGSLQLGNGGTTGSLSTSSAITVNASGTFTINRSNAVAQGTDFSGAAIAGAGKFLQAGAGTTTLNIANTYSGGTIISGGTLIATVDGALGSGNVSLTGGTVTLTLQTGATNNYIADAASISIVSGGAIANLNYSGTDTVAGITLGGVLQTTAGTYGSTSSGATFQDNNFFSGTGTLTLVPVPEPSTWMMLGVGAVLLVGVQRFRRKR
jgi:autotransporter-associated beta strand protein